MGRMCVREAWLLLLPSLSLEVWYGEGRKGLFITLSFQKKKAEEPFFFPPLSLLFCADEAQLEK